MSKAKSKKPSNSSRRLRFVFGTALVGLALGALALAGLNANPPPPAASPVASGTASVDAAVIPGLAEVQRRAIGVTYGKGDAGPFYVFFDPQCPHCATLFEELKPFAEQARFVWVPVGVLGKTSVRQGATILGADDPLATFLEHEELMTQRKGGISAWKDPSQAALDQMAANTQLFQAQGVRAVPYVMGLHARTKAPVTHLGSGTTDQMGSLLGLSRP